MSLSILYIQPRRFGELWQMSEDWPGTIAQQQAVRDALTPVHGSNVHKLAQKLDRDVNKPINDPLWAGAQHFLPIAFVDTGGFLARGFSNGILLSYRLSTDPGIIAGIVRHEAGHVYDQRLMTQDDRFYYMDLISGNHNGNWVHEYQETFADSFRDWWASDGEVWPELTPMLLRPQDDS